MQHEHRMILIQFCLHFFGEIKHRILIEPRHQREFSEETQLPLFPSSVNNDLSSLAHRSQDQRMSSSTSERLKNDRTNNNIATNSAKSKFFRSCSH